jgi:EAL domain-containing protein (putative c-di-GMP-specific phosphodiesterase class I)
MHFLGIFLSIGAIVLMFVSSGGRNFVTTVYSLSPEITVLIFIGYCYPLFLFGYTYLRNKNEITKKFFHSQAALASMFCVSLGLIGTFIGLSAMVSAISSGMNADGDFSTKINTLLASIGSSLDSMSLAFLTSILGVGASTVLAVSCNYLEFFYVDGDKNNVSKNGTTHSNTSPSTNTNIGLSASETKEVINKALDSKMFEILGDSISKSNTVQKQIAACLDRIEITQQHIYEDGLKTLSVSSDNIVEQISNNNQSIKASQQAFEIFDANFKQSVDDFKGGFERMADSLGYIGTELEKNTSNSEYIQKFTERFDNKFDNYTINVDIGLGNVTEVSERVVGEINTVNSNLTSLYDSFENFNYKSKDNDSYFTNMIDTNTQTMTQLTSIMLDLKFLLAPPLNDSLKLAIKNDSLDILYQSQVNTNNEVVGCEVLLEWTDPIRGTISNTDIFGPEMDAHPDLLVLLDKYVIEHSIKQLAEWTRSGAWNSNWVLSINVVPQMAMGSFLIPYLKEIITKYSVDSKYIALEFKESIVLKNIDTIKEVFFGIKNIGSKVYVDNYGKGFTSLITFQQLKVDKLKIERSVINELINENGDSSIIRSIMASAKELNLELVAEGVENNDQKLKLEELGFKFFQGFYIARPVSGVDYISG